MKLVSGRTARLHTNFSLLLAALCTHSLSELGATLLSHTPHALRRRAVIASGSGVPASAMRAVRLPVRMLGFGDCFLGQVHSQFSTVALP